MPYPLVSCLTMHNIPADDPLHPAYLPTEDQPHLPRVLLIGDSISIGYTVTVRELLGGTANVHRIPENGRDTEHGLKQLDTWLGDQPWELIHFNFGLHDIKHVKGAKWMYLVCVDAHEPHTG